MSQRKPYTFQNFVSTSWRSKKNGWKSGYTYFWGEYQKYFISCVEKNQNFHECALVKILMCSTYEMKYIWYLPQKSKFLFYFIHFIDTCNVSPIENGGAENAKTKNFSQPKQFWYQDICHVLTKKMPTHTWFVRSQISKLCAFQVPKWNALSEWKSDATVKI